MNDQMYAALFLILFLIISIIIINIYFYFDSKKMSEDLCKKLEEKMKQEPILFDFNGKTMMYLPKEGKDINEAFEEFCKRNGN